jgi:dephospho-CoA kinase
MPRVWILTGGIGSGKSTIRRQLESMGVAAIDADSIAHQVYEPDGPAFAAIAHRWPEVVVEGRVDRSALAGIVFADPAALAELEAIVHPEVALTILRQIDAGPAEDVVVELSVPHDLLGVGESMTIIADLDDRERLRRLVARGMDPHDVARRMSRQPSRAEWRRLGRHVISTEGTRQEVAERVRRWWSGIQELEPD